MIDDAAIARLRTANPIPDMNLISAADLDSVAAAVEQARTGARSPDDLIRLGAPAGWWLRPTIAFAAALLLGIAIIGVVSLATGEEGTSRPAATAPTIAADPLQRDWSDVLATTRAAPLSRIASCNINPLPGSATQERPGRGWVWSLSGAFDPGRGLIFYVDSWRETWAFDVCNNTWFRYQPEGRPPEYPSGGLVYDVDSDVLIAMGLDIAVYDPVRNTWTYPDDGAPTGPGAPFGGVYDPISGLIVTTIYPQGDDVGERVEAWAYDVDSNEWLYLGVIAAEGEDRPWQYDLIGYSGDLDRLILTPSEAEPVGHTMLIDPRSGEREVIWTPSPTISLGWPQAHFGVGSGSTFVAGVNDDGANPPEGPGEFICGFDPETRRWSRCYSGPGRPLFGAYTWFGAMVGDPINNRLVLIGGVYGEFGAMTTGHVWGIDYETGTVVELVPDRS